MTIDGLAGAGKSTLAALLAEPTGTPVLDVGTLYRRLAAWATNTAGQRVDELTINDVHRLLADIGTGGDNGVLRDEGVELRLPEISSNDRVRHAVRQWQIGWARQRERSVVVGRVGGAEIFPDAFLKIYLTADAAVRAERGQATGAVSRETWRTRDEADGRRRIAPLRAARDALVIDTTSLPPHDVRDVVRRAIVARAGQDGHG